MSSFRDPIGAVPSALIQWITNTFCDDASSVALAHTQKLTFRLLKDSYHVRGEVEYVCARVLEGKPQQENSPAVNNVDLPSAKSTSVIAGPSRVSIEVVYLCLMAPPQELVRRHFPEQGALDPRSYNLPTYFLTTSDNASQSRSRSPHRIGIPDNIAIRIPRREDEGEEDETNENFSEEATAELTNSMLDALPATIGSLRLEHHHMTDLLSLTRLTRLHTLTLEKLKSLACLNEIATFPHLRVLRIDGRSNRDSDWDGVDLPETPDANITDNVIIILPPALEELYIIELAGLVNRLVIHDNLRVLQSHGHKLPLQEWKLPDTLTELRLGDCLNTNVDGWTPPTSLRTLIFGEQFNQDISKIVWPPGLTRLVFGRHFYYSLSNVSLPHSMLHLEFASTNPDMFGHIPDGATRSDNPFAIPPRLESFLIDSNISFDPRRPRRDGFVLDLPHTLTRLALCTKIILDIPNWKWPNSITELQLDAHHMIEKEDFTLPPRLRILHLSGNTIKTLRKFTLPATIESLTIASDILCSMPFLETLVLTCHETLRTLKLGRISQKSMAHIQLPQTLTHLELPSNWNRPVSELPQLPSSLRYLKFGTDWNQSLNGLELPSSLLRLHFGRLSQDLAPLSGVLPNLRHLTLPYWSSRVCESLPKLVLPPYCRVSYVINFNFHFKSFSWN